MAVLAIAPVAWAQAAEPVIEWRPASAFADAPGAESSAAWLITDVAAFEPAVRTRSPMPRGMPNTLLAGRAQAGVSGLWQLGDGLAWQLQLHKTSAAGPVEDLSPVATIQCERGWLGASSMTGRNCRVTGFEQSHAAMSGLWSPLPGLQTELGMFRRRESERRPIYLDTVGSGLSLLNQPRLAGGEYLGREYSGVDLGLRFEFPVSAMGRFAVDADVARILDYSVATRGGALPLAGSRENLSRSQERDFARLQFDWSRGEFSGGIESLYREVPPFDPGRGENNSAWTSFNVHFTWRTPWNGALSFGATNVLDDSPDEGRNPDPRNETFDSIYGRIPYVRYKQDL